MLSFDKKTIGIFGGSFDPPHKGHVEISKISLKKMSDIARVVNYYNII